MTLSLINMDMTKLTGRNSRKRWMLYALGLSLFLHIGSAVVIIIACGSGGHNKTSLGITIQDVELTPSISAPAKSTVPLQPMAIPEAPIAAPSTDSEKVLQDSMSGQTAPPPANSEPAGALLSTRLGLGMTHGYFSSLADGRTLRDDIRVYYFEMAEKINQEWWDKAELLVDPLRRDGIFELLIQQDGTVISVRIIQGTGSREADQLLDEVIRRASPLRPLPASYGSDTFRAPLRVKAPSYLFRK